MTKHYRRMPRRKQCSKRGHDLTIPNARYKNGRCVMCNRERRVDYENATVVPMMSVKPLQRLMRGDGRNYRQLARAFSDFHGSNYDSALRQVQRLLTPHGHKQLISLSTADEWCLALGTHPFLIYPELYPEALQPYEESA